MQTTSLKTGVSTAVEGEREAAGFVPAYQHIENDLRRRVQEAVWGPGAMLPGRDELAQHYNVARGTVQRAIQNLIAEGTLRADHRRGTFVATDIVQSRPPETAIKAPARQMIALITQLGTLIEGNPQIDHYPPMIAIMQGINRTLQKREAPFHLVTFNTRSGDGVQTCGQDITLERQALEALETENFPGAILWHVGEAETAEPIRRLLAKDFPLVFLDRYYGDLIGDCVGIDNYGSARKATEYLISFGHTRIAHLTTEEDIHTIRERLEGYRDALNTRGIAFDPALVQTVSYLECGERMPKIVEQYFGLSDPPTAVFVVNDGWATNFIKAAEEQGHRIPEDISVIGMDDLEQFLPGTPRLTTMRQPFEQIGQRAAELLLSRLAHTESLPQRARSIELPTRLIVRETCRAR